MGGDRNPGVSAVSVPLLEGLASTSVNPLQNQRNSFDEGAESQWGVSCRRKVKARVRGAWREIWRRKAIRKLLVFSVFVPLAVAVQILFTRTGRMLGRRHMMVFQQAASMAYLVCILPWLWYLSARTRTVTSRIRRMSKYKFIVMGFLDCVSTYCVYHGVNGTSLSAQTVFTQAQLPLMVVLSLVVLRKKFLLWQYLGGFLIVCGIVVEFVGHAKDFKSDIHNVHADLWLMVVFIFSSVPSTISSIYKDWSFQKSSMNVLYLTGWATIFNVMWGFVLSPLGAIPIFGEMETAWDVPVMYKEGAYCLFGKNSRPGDNCNKPWLMIMCLTLCRVMYSFSFLAIVKHGGIRLMVWSMITVTVLTNFAATQAWVMGDLSYMLSVYDFFAVGLVILGLLMYGITKSFFKNESQSVGDVGMSTVVLESHLSGMKRAFGGRAQGGDPIQSRSSIEIRNAYFQRLGIPIQSSHLPDRAKEANRGRDDSSIV